jgi:glycosidase
MLAAIHENSRDNARTPMQWTSGDNAGFTQGAPWIDLNPNYYQINVADALNDTDSVFYHYQALIKLRKQYPVIVYGEFVPLFEDHPSLFAYVRQDNDHQLLIVSNFGGEECVVELPKQYCEKTATTLLTNYTPRSSIGGSLTLYPYESFVVELS